MASADKEPYVVHLICSSGFYGAEKVVCNLFQDPPAKHMAVLCLTNLNNAMFSFKSSVTHSGSQFYLSKNKTMSALKALVDLTSAHKTVVIHAHGYKEVFVACLFQQFRGCRVVVTQHGFTARNFKSKCYNLVNLVLCRWGKIENVICVSQNIYHQYQQFGVPLQRLTLLPNAIMVPAQQDKVAARIQMNALYDLPQGIPLILYAGRLSEEKDPFLFTNVVREMKSAQADFIAVIAGEGPLEKAVLDSIEKQGLTGSVKMLGFVEDMHELLAAADILLLTSKTEGTPMIVLEAMALNCPVVASNVGGLADIIRSNEDGILVDTRDPTQFSVPCLELLNDADKLKSFSQNAYKKVHEKYCLSSSLPIYQRLYGSDR